MANTDYLSNGTTVFSNLSLSGDVKSSSASISVATVGTQVVRTSLDLKTLGGVLSMATAANAAGMTEGQLRIVFQASGISLLYSSGATQYTIGGSAVSLAQS